MVTTATRPAIRRRNIADIPTRWAAALDRATEKGLRLYQHEASGQWFATSSDGTSVHAVSWFTCECRAAAEGDPVCLHRAAFRRACQEEDHDVERNLAQHGQQGVPTFDEAEEVTLLVAPAGRMCTDCLGTGTARMYTGGRHNDWVPVTCGCGAGRRAA